MDINETVDYTEDIIKVEPVLGDLYKLKISWPAIPGAIGYHVYGAPHVLNGNKLTDDPITETEFIVDLPIVPSDTQWFFWVFWIDASGTETLIQQDPATLESQKNPFLERNNPLTGNSDLYLPNEMMQYYASEIRTRNKAMLENDGEDFTIYMRRWQGLPCTCVPGTTTALGSDPDLNRDSDYDGVHRCELCFGTGILAGYFPALTIKVRYGNLPTRSIVFGNYGISLEHTFNSWTLWVPRIHHHDVLVRHRTNERFLVKDPKVSEWRGVPLHQEFTASPLSAGDVRNLITNDKIYAALALSNTFDVARFQSSLWQ